MTKSTGTFSKILCIFFCAALALSCNGPADGGESPSAADSPGRTAAAAKRPVRFDSLRLCLPQGGAIFDSLHRTDPQRWQLVADLLGYYYSARWDTTAQAPEGPAIDAGAIDKRLSAAPSCWSMPAGKSPYAEYTALSQQAERLTDFATSGPAEESLRLGLERFMKLYLDARCRAQLAALPQARWLAASLQREQAAWREHLSVERRFVQTLYHDSLNLVSDDMGRRIGTFLASRQERRAEADRNLLFALSSPEEFKLPHAEYVTWAVTMGRYAQLQEKYTRYGAPHLKRALAEESAAWFQYMQTRAHIEELLGDSPVGKAYDTTTRLLKKQHLDDLQTW